MAKSKILEATATTTPQRFQFSIFAEIQYLANDSSSNTLQINFDGDIGQNGTRTLYALEVLDKIPMDCSYITVQSIGGDVPFRLSGV